MTDLLKMILSLSLSGTLLILAFFLLKPLWKDKLSKRWQYYIWMVVVARLLLPLAPETNLIGTLVQRLDTNEAYTKQLKRKDPGLQTETQQEFIAGENDTNGKKGRPAVANPLPVQNAPTLSAYIFLIWFVTALVLFVRKITIYQGFARYIKAVREPVDDIKVLNRLGTLMSEAGIKRNIELATNPLISSTLFMGFLRPCIVLPDAALSDTCFCHTIRHELTHYKRRDMLYKQLVQLVVCIHWFNPFVYLMQREINRACELSCDEAVIRHMDAEDKAAYGDTLLNAMEAGGNYKDSLASVTLYTGNKLLKERLGAIMKFTSLSKRRKFITALLTLAICIGAAFAGGYTIALKSAPEQANIENKESGRITSEQLAERVLAFTSKIGVRDMYASRGKNQMLPEANAPTALALTYIETTGQFGHIYNLRPYMTTAGIDAAVKAYLDTGGDPGVVLAILPYMSETAAKEIPMIHLSN